MTWAGFGPSGTFWTPNPGRVDWEYPQGDVSGVIDSLIVIGIHGYPISSIAPSSGYIMYYDGSQWIPSSQVVLSGVAGGSGVGPHNLLSSTHTDTLSSTPAVGDIITASGAPAVWTRLPIGSGGQFLTVNSGTNIPDWGYGNLEVFSGSGINVNLSNYSRKVIIRQSGAIGNINLPPSPIIGQEIVIKDGLGNANLYNLNINALGGKTIDGLSQIKITNKYQAWQMTWTGYEWSLV